MSKMVFDVDKYAMTKHLEADGQSQLYNNEEDCTPVDDALPAYSLLSSPKRRQE